MTGGERYLERQAKRLRSEYLKALPSTTQPAFRLDDVRLPDAPACLRQRLHQILHFHHHHRAPDSQEDENSSVSGMRLRLEKVVFDTVNVASFVDSGITRFDFASQTHAATIIGSSQQGKTSLLNSLFALFGFAYPDSALVFPSSDLLPTHSKHRTGLPFPLRLEYGPKYELRLHRWNADRLQDVMCKVAERALAQNSDFFEELESGFESVTEGSFLEFVAQHGSVDTEGGYVPKASAAETLEADSGVECHDFAEDGYLNPSLQLHQILPQFLIALVEDARWFRYEHVTLKCPSQLLKHLKTGSEAAHDTRVLDLPGVGIVDDNNSLVEELVLRDVRNAGSIIVLTGERSFTQDILHVLKSSVFEKLLDPAVIPRPTVAITNSWNLRGLKPEEMDTWRAATLNGSLGWNRELQAFAEERFTGRRHRELLSLEPDLFPNDLEGFMQSRTGAHEKGVSMLVGYFLRLPQEALIACVTDVLERARSVMNMVDQLWQAEKVSWKGLHSSRLMKEAKRLRDEGFLNDLDAELTISAQKKVFGFESEAAPGEGGAKTLQTQVHYVQKLFREQKEKLAQRFEKLKVGKCDWKQELPRLVKESLLQIASQWDENVGEQAFSCFLSHGERISKSLYNKWARKVFQGGARGEMERQKQEQACQFMMNYLNATASSAIRGGTFKCTWTHGLRQQAWNLDLKDITKVLGLRRGRSTSTAYNQVWMSIQELMKAKEALFTEQILEHMSSQSASTKQLIRRLKQVVMSTFEECERNFTVVMDALQRIADGKLALSGDPVVILREELQSLVKEVDRYLTRHREMRDSFGAQELKRVLQMSSHT